MLLNNKTKDNIREKFNMNKENKDNVLNIKKIKKEKIKNKSVVDEIDDIYTVEHIDTENTNYSDDVIGHELVFPIEREISSQLPNRDYIILTDYNKEQKDFTYNITLEKGYPPGKNQTIRIVIYQINNFNTLPFLTYLLYKYNKQDDNLEHLSLLEISLDTSDNVKSKTKNIIKNIIFKEYTDKPKYKGYRQYKGDSYLFFEYSPKKEEIVQMVMRDNNWLWCIVDEIINDKNSLMFPIKSSTTEFFLNNLDILSIYKKDNITTFETPVIGYYGNHYKKINFVSVFGIPRSSTFSSLGPFYVFASYAPAVKYAMFPSHKKVPEVIDGEPIFDENRKYIKGGLVRFAVFIGKTKFLNELVVEKYNISNKSWSQNYNSAFIGQYETKGIKFAVKQSMQQVPLSYHHIDTATDEIDFEKIKIM